VLIEGTTLSEGRGTTRALELVGAPEVDFGAVLKAMRKSAPRWCDGALFRVCSFEPTFHKHQGKLCGGIQVHTDSPCYRPGIFKPFRLVSLLLKEIRRANPGYPIYRDFAYEYVKDRLAFDVINGGPELREWINDAAAKPGDLERVLLRDEKAWARERKPFLLYP
jgi:uncharacterized protein YbbC (DUF1343 family)